MPKKGKYGPSGRRIYFKLSAMIPAKPVNKGPYTMPERPAKTLENPIFKVGVKGMENIPATTFNAVSIAVPHNDLTFFSSFALVFSVSGSCFISRKAFI